LKQQNNGGEKSALLESNYWLQISRVCNNNVICTVSCSCSEQWQNKRQQSPFHDKMEASKHADLSDCLAYFAVLNSNMLTCKSQWTWLTDQKQTLLIKIWEIHKYLISWHCLDLGEGKFWWKYNWYKWIKNGVLL